jgi:hypothetical protein
MIYVETLIHGSLEDLWTKTQTPEKHQKWDLRFTRIEYLPKSDPAGSQRFLYETRIGFGLQISGEGETKGISENDGSRTSALKFWSEDPKSLILEGSGYWKYIPEEKGIRFLTWYDYRTRFGKIGRILDWLLFRPLLGWATAWSFDRLRLWIEKQIEPSVSLTRSVIHAISRLTIAFLWFYHGLVPKLIYPQNDEITILVQSGVSLDQVPNLLHILGFLEVGLGILFLIAWNTRWLFLLNIVLMIIALLAVSVYSPRFLAHAFNPVTLNFCVISLSLIGLLISSNLPSARRCLRKPSEKR